VRRGEEEEEVNLSSFLSSDRSVFKLVFGGLNVLGLAPNLVSSFLYFEYFDPVTQFEIWVSEDSDLRAV
jgi:hypothetical protein